MSGKRVDSVRLIWLEAFVKAADLGSFSEAGKALGISQSNVSRYVGSVGDWLGGMAVMHAGTTALTATGEKFLPIAREVVDRLTDAHTAFALKTFTGTNPAAPRLSAKDIKI